jgi:hypothetical protein
MGAGALLVARDEVFNKAVAVLGENGVVSTGEEETA